MIQPSRILIVDDDPIARHLYEDSLTEVGYQVRGAGDARAAAQQLDEEPFDVVVTDLILPGADGLAVLADAKRRDPGIEVIVITAVDRVDPAVRAIKSGAADYLVKPVPPESLLLSISRCIATRQLLKENEVLRGHLSLVETGQRIATTLDREHLYPLALDALAGALSSSRALLLARRPDGRFELAGKVGFEADEADRLAALALPAAEAAEPGRHDLAVDGKPVPAVVAEAGGHVFGVCLLKDPRAEAVAWSNASFLARHLAIALKNLNRLSAAEDLAFIDDLTRLHNMRFLHLVLDREINNSKQTGNPFSVLFLDLDHFKSVNDAHGHLSGSNLLVEAGTLLKGCVRDIDVVARYGGDEYVVVLVNTDAGGALKVAERIRRTMESHKFLAKDGLGLSLTACVGVASYPEHARDKHQILDCADRAMYRGKQTTRNVIYVASPAEAAARA